MKLFGSDEVHVNAMVSSDGDVTSKFKYWKQLEAKLRFTDEKEKDNDSLDIRRSATL